MKKAIFLLLLLLIATPCFGQQQEARVLQGVIGGGVPATGGYADVLFYWGAESTATEKSGKTMTLGGACEISSTQHAVGSYSMSDYKGSGDPPFSTTTIVSQDIISQTAGRIGFYVYPTTGWYGYAQYAYFLKAQYVNYTNAIFCRTIGATLGEVECGYLGNGGGDYFSTTSCGLTADTWTFIEFTYGGTPSMSIKCDGTQRGSSATAVTSPVNDFDTLQIGDAGGTGMMFYIDQVLISNSPTRDLNAIKTETSF